MIYQSHVSANRLDVMKDTFRKFEKEANRNYWKFMISVTVVIFITIFLTYAIDDDNKYYFVVKIVVNLAILGVQGVVLRQYIETTNWFLQNMKRGFHYEYKRHVVRETILFILMLVSFSLCDLANLLIYANDMSFFICTSFNQNISLDPKEMDVNSLCRLTEPSVACYEFIPPILCISYALPAFCFVLVSRPHDCFYCLSKRPENRISIFQYPMADLERRMDPSGSERLTGGAFDGFIFNSVKKLDSQM